MFIYFVHKKRMRLSPLVVICCTTFLVCSCFADGILKDQLPDWDRIRIAYDKYSAYPTSENAKVVLDLFPLESTNTEKGNREHGLDHIFLSDNFMILENEILAGERNSVEIAFRLLICSDAGYSERLYLTIGKLIRINPRLFIEVYSWYLNQSLYFKRAEQPVYMVNEAYFQRISAHKYELEMRIKALERVTDQIFLVTREACIKRLRKAIKELGAT